MAKTVLLIPPVSSVCYDEQSNRHKRSLATSKFAGHVSRWIWSSSIFHKSVTDCVATTAICTNSLWYLVRSTVQSAEQYHH